ncbi:MAG: hypothetical protein K8R88_03815 [Armatimonadetes bacterium]|nr:hypothetical protein [Armatimonadota bacterium]
MKKKLVIIIPLVLILVVGGVFFAAKSGAINIPGISPSKKKVAKKPIVEVKKELPKVAPPKEDPVVKPKVAVLQVDPVKGAKKLAKLWNEMPAPALLASVKDWKDAELARVIGVMDPEKASILLGQMEPARLDLVSREIQKQASIVPPEE